MQKFGFVDVETYFVLNKLGIRKLVLMIYSRIPSKPYCFYLSFFSTLVMKYLEKGTFRIFVKE